MFILSLSLLLARMLKGSMGILKALQLTEPRTKVGHQAGACMARGAPLWFPVGAPWWGRESLKLPAWGPPSGPGSLVHRATLL